MGATREQGILAELAEGERPGAVVHHADVAAWCAHERIDPDGLEREREALGREAPGATRTAILAFASLCAAIVFIISLKPVGDGTSNGWTIAWTAVCATLFVAAVVAMVRVEDSRLRSGDRVLEIGRILRRHEAMRSTTIEIGDEKILVRDLRRGSADSRLIPAGFVASTEVTPEGDGHHVTLALRTLDGSRTGFPWIPATRAAMDAFERFQGNTRAGGVIRDAAEA